MRADILLALLPAVALAAPATTTLNRRAPLHIPRGVELVENKYIVKLKTPQDGEMSIAAAEGTKKKIEKCTKDVKEKADFVYETLGGFAGTLSDEEVEALRDNPDVEFIEQDHVTEMFATTSQSNAPWGLARLSSSRPGSRTYTFDDSAGEGACAYVIDTGVQADHPEFEGRAQQVANFVSRATTDDQGHGTHCAGTIASKSYGVAKKAKVFGVKVLGADGRGLKYPVFASQETVLTALGSYTIAGMNYVLQDTRTRASSCPRGSVVNMSLGGGRSTSVNAAARAIVDANIFLAVAAGNGDQFGRPQPISTTSPASETSACTVGATDSNDRVASFSNYGPELDVYAPGVSVLSTYPGGRTNTLSGTSMATPHVAGLAAYYLGLGKSSASNMCEYLKSTGLRNAISGVPSGTANVLIQNDKA